MGFNFCLISAKQKVLLGRRSLLLRQVRIGGRGPVTGVHAQVVVNATEIIYRNYFSIMCDLPDFNLVVQC